MRIYSLNFALIVERAGIIEGYPMQAIRRVHAELDEANAVWIIIVDFIATKTCPETSLRIRLDQVTNQSGWNNTSEGAVQAVTDILEWSAPLSSGVASEATLSEINTNTQSFERDVVVIRTSSAGTIAAGTYSVSFSCTGTGDSLVQGTVFRSGEVLNIDAGALNNTLGAISYDASGAYAELLIVTLT